MRRPSACILGKAEDMSHYRNRSMRRLQIVLPLKQIEIASSGRHES